MIDYEKAIINHLINALDDCEFYENVVENAMEDLDLKWEDDNYEEACDEGLLICKALSDRLINYLENLDKI